MPAGTAGKRTTEEVIEGYQSWWKIERKKEKRKRKEKRKKENQQHKQSTALACRGDLAYHNGHTMGVKVIA